MSLHSGENVYRAAVSLGYEAYKVLLEKDGVWTIDNQKVSERKALSFLKEKRVLVIPVIHGTYGEDGILQDLLEKNDIRYAGSVGEVMKLTIDKYATGEILSANAIRVPQSVVFDRRDPPRYILPFPYPVIVKPRNEGSSVSLYKVQDQTKLQEVLAEELEKRGQVLIQECVVGREFTCGVVELDGKLQPLPPTEVMLTKGDLFDYNAKYNVGGCQEITPANIPTDLLERIQALAIQVHTICGCKDISRTDMILNEQSELVVLEINTIPGMTETSFIPAQLQAAGFTLSDFVKSMVVKYS